MVQSFRLTTFLSQVTRDGSKETKIKWWNFGAYLLLLINGTVPRTALYVYICHIFDGLYASRRVKANLFSIISTSIVSSSTCMLAPAYLHSGNFLRHQYTSCADNSSLITQRVTLNRY